MHNYKNQPYTKQIHIEIPKDAERIITTLVDAGYEAFVVGGCVRDSIIGREPKDWDITTSASPKQVKALFNKTIDTGIEHGTVTVMMHHEGYEVTTYRIDGEYEDSRHPKEVTFTTNLIEDLKRRDFTINAMAYSPGAGLVDAFDGLGDLKRRLITCVGDPMARFGEDALRIMRAIRFAAQLNYEIDPATQEAMKTLAPNLKNISAERIQVELVKLLVSPHPELIRKACDLGLTAVFLPEYDEIRGLMPKSDNHCLDVENHTIEAMRSIEAKTSLRLAMLMHDFGRAVTDREAQAGFLADEKSIGAAIASGETKDHAAISAKMADKILRRLKFDNYTRERVVHMILWHSYKFDASEASVRRALNRVGEDLFADYLKVLAADAKAKKESVTRERLALLEDVAATCEKILAEGQCFTIKGLAIGGRDLMAAGVKQGPGIGRILTQLLEAVIDDQNLNQREKLLEMGLSIAVKM